MRESEKEREGARERRRAHEGGGRTHRLFIFFPFLLLTHKAIFKVMEMCCISSSSRPLDNPFISNTQMNGWVGVGGSAGASLSEGKGSLTPWTRLYPLHPPPPTQLPKIMCNEKMGLHR